MAFFEEVLKLNGGEFEGVPFVLLGWQQFVVGSIFGWKTEDGHRRFRVAYIETAKGSGKSPLAAGVGLKGLMADGESRAEVYAAATKKDQAMILFRDAVAMVQQSKALDGRITKSGAGERVWNLAYLQTMSFFRPISSDDGQSGPRPHMALIDELHEHKTNAVVEMMRAGTKSRRQALIFIITNAGSNKSGPCWGYHEAGRKVASGEFRNDAMFAFICSLDEGDDPFKDEACWQKANPSLQEANLPGYKYIKEQMDEARGMPGKEALVRRLNFCQWTGAESPWISKEVWDEQFEEFDWRTLRGRRAWGGLDLSSTTDLTGLVWLVEPLTPPDPDWDLEEQGPRPIDQRWLMIPVAWLPEVDLDLKAVKDGVPYVEWKTEGFLHTTHGKAISKRIVLQRLSAFCDFFDVQAVGYDRWRIEDLLALAEDEGISLPTMVPVGQGFASMTPMIEEFERRLLQGEFAHNDHKVLNYCIGNCVIVMDDTHSRKLSKAKATGRIDLGVCAVMATGISMTAEAKEDLDEALNDPISSYA